MWEVDCSRLSEYRSGTVNLKSFVSKDFLRIKWKYEIIVHFKHEMIGIWQRFHRYFELTVFELTVPDLYMLQSTTCANDVAATKT